MTHHFDYFLKEIIFVDQINRKFVQKRLRKIGHGELISFVYHELLGCPF